jgi:hypothetical protein
VVAVRTSLYGGRLYASCAHIIQQGDVQGSGTGASQPDAAAKTKTVAARPFRFDAAAALAKARRRGTARGRRGGEEGASCSECMCVFF